MPHHLRGGETPRPSPGCSVKRIPSVCAARLLDQGSLNVARVPQRMADENAV
jgi:hypothetical protein